MPHPVFRSGARALITGGASGVGLAIAKICASHGMRISLVDVNASALLAAQSQLASADVSTHALDVSDGSQWSSLQTAITSRYGDELDLLVLNAGTSQKHTFGDTAAFQHILGVNFFGYVHGISTFLPAVQKAQQSGSGQTAIVLTGSKQGITNPPGNPAYNASKAAVKSLAEQLSWDLRSSGTSVHLLVPGWTFTGLTGAVAGKNKPEGAWAPEQVAEYLTQKMEKGSFYVICPDNDVTEDMDRRRMLWAAGDAVYDRPALSRWREDWKEKAQEGIDNTKL